MHKICLYNYYKTGQITFSEKTIISVSKSVKQNRMILHTHIDEQRKNVIHPAFRSSCLNTAALKINSHFFRGIQVKHLSSKHHLVSLWLWTWGRTAKPEEEQEPGSLEGQDRQKPTLTVQYIKSHLSWEL